MYELLSEYDWVHILRLSSDFRFHSDYETFGRLWENLHSNPGASYPVVNGIGEVIDHSYHWPSAWISEGVRDAKNRLEGIGYDIKSGRFVQDIETTPEESKELDRKLNDAYLEQLGTCPFESQDEADPCGDQMSLDEFEAVYGFR